MKTLSQNKVKYQHGRGGSDFRDRGKLVVGIRADGREMMFD
jgi:hypothetical protein